MQAVTIEKWTWITPLAAWLVLIASMIAAVVLGMAGTYIWRKRLSWHAPRAQQVEAEKAI